MKNTFWYFPLESLKARYTDQLCNDWMPATFSECDPLGFFTFRRLETPLVSDDIHAGSVLDAVNRGVVSLQQCSAFLNRMSAVQDGDVLFFQDMWTPGIEAILYALHQFGRKVRIYAMCHAQSVDEYDFTWPMRSWMRPIEKGWSRGFAGIFVASTIHRDQLRLAGIECPIHVVGLPIHSAHVMQEMDKVRPAKLSPKQVIFTSRLNNEKNPFFMLDVASMLLSERLDTTWVVTTSATEFSSEVKGVLPRMHQLASIYPGRFMMRSGLTKAQYYSELCSSRVQFNCALQDYVSWTLLEAAAAGCDLVYPDFRSFPECIPATRRYPAFSVPGAVDLLHSALANPKRHYQPVDVSNLGRQVEMAIMLHNWQGPEVNVWHQPEAYFKAQGLLPE